MPTTPTTAMDALMAKVDAVIRTTGTDPATVSTNDKLLLAAQYIEVCYVHSLSNANANAGRVRL